MRCWKRHEIGRAVFARRRIRSWKGQSSGWRGPLPDGFLSEEMHAAEGIGARLGDPADTHRSGEGRLGSVPRLSAQVSLPRRRSDGRRAPCPVVLVRRDIGLHCRDGGRIRDPETSGQRASLSRSSRRPARAARHIPRRRARVPCGNRTTDAQMTHFVVSCRVLGRSAGPNGSGEMPCTESALIWGSCAN